MGGTDSNPRGDVVPYHVHRFERLPPDADVLVFAAYCPSGAFTPLHRLQLRAYAAEGYALAVVVNSPTGDLEADPGEVPGHILIVRENIGFDFGAWGHLVRLVDGLDLAHSVSFANDSVIGPLPGDGSALLRGTVEDIRGEAVFMTESTQILPHGQSYFFAFKRGALERGALNLVRGAQYHGERRNLILKEEVVLAGRLRALEIAVGIAFPHALAGLQNLNPTVFYWSELLDSGLPFVKLSLVPDGQIGIDAPELRTAIGPEFHAALVRHLEARPALPAVNL